MQNVFPFCIGMLLTYYATAVLTRGVYSRSVIIGWAVFALFSPLMAYFAWMTKERGVFPKSSARASRWCRCCPALFFFDRLRIYDLIIDGLLIYFLFSGKLTESDRE